MAAIPEKDQKRDSKGRPSVSASQAPSKGGVSFRATVVFAFAMIAGSTAAILLIITIFIFNTYFSSYTIENMAEGVQMESMLVPEDFMSDADIQFRNNTVEALIIAGGISLLVAILLGIFFSNWIVAPIKRITAAANQLSEGNLSARTGMTGDNELSQLGRQFDRMAESIESDRMMELRLTSDVAHELRTPLMAVQATVEAMIDGVYETDVEHLSVVDSEIRRLSHLVDALLRLSRLERRSSPLNEEVTDLGVLARTMVASHEVFVHDSGLAIEVHVDGTVQAYCDRDLIRQAVANLISNAVRYTPEGGRIDIYVHETNTSDGPMAVIDVKDTGIGLTEEEAKMVFARFWRSEKRRNDNSAGLGIGLTVVKEIVDRHKGTIAVEGEPGKGSMFSIMIPAYRPEKPDKEGRESFRSGKTGKGYKPIRAADRS